MYDKKAFDSNLDAKYGIKPYDVYLAKLIRILRGTAHPPKLIYRYSNKHYGIRYDFSRYYIDRFSNIPIGKYS